MSSQSIEELYKKRQAEYDEAKSARIAYLTRMNDAVQRASSFESSAWDMIENLSPEGRAVLQDKLPPKEELTLDNIVAHKEAWKAAETALEAYCLKLLKE